MQIMFLPSEVLDIKTAYVVYHECLQTPPVLLYITGVFYYYCCFPENG